MCLFIETIRIERGNISLLDYHNERCNRTRNAFFPSASPLNLSHYLQSPFGEEVIKCRIIYDESVREVTYAPYQMRPINSLRMVEADAIDYRFKYTHREVLDELFGQRAAADDVLIVRDKLLTDTSIANIALYDGTAWHTPTQPLLKGTRRAALLDARLLQEATICMEELEAYSHIALFNSMIDFGKIVLPINRVHKA